MDKKTLQEIQAKLQSDKELLEKELHKFAKKDEKLEGNWNTVYPREEGSQKIEEAADEVEEYENLLSIEYSFETKLKNINMALEKIEKGNYGKCEKCGKEMAAERLQACPEARTCAKCK
ncbi:MAG: TraR/DksA C4-type zinc finger protein [bacterium]